MKLKREKAKQNGNWNVKTVLPISDLFYMEEIVVSYLRVSNSDHYMVSIQSNVEESVKNHNSIQFQNLPKKKIC